MKQRAIVRQSNGSIIVFETHACSCTYAEASASASKNYSLHTRRLKPKARKRVHPAWRQRHEFDVYQRSRAARIAEIMKQVKAYEIPIDPPHDEEFRVH